jgi:hypothetical protein
MGSVEGSFSNARPELFASPARIFTSSLFSYFFVAIGGYFVSNATAEQIVGTNGGIVSDLVKEAVWLVAAFVAGLVAGYRSAGKGWMSGLLVGVYSTVGVLVLVQYIAWSERVSWADFLGSLSTSQEWIFFTLLALVIPSATYGGTIGDRFYREIGHLEEPAKHTLFHIPWWHWIWIKPASELPAF